MTQKVLVICVVGLTPRGLAHAPRLAALADTGFLAPLSPCLPAVTCTVQSSLLTGLRPQEHGIVANGWYLRELAEVMFWRQSNALVGGEKLWEAARARDPAARCAKLFWWYNMYSSADWSVTPRPAYPADGRKIPDIYAEPPQLRRELNERLGRFPLFNFWGPTADIRSSAWITDAALQVLDQHQPELALVYLPHLDYNLQRLGPDHPEIPRDIAAIDAQAGRLIDRALGAGYQVIAVSEYGITAVSDAVPLNRALRAAGFLRVQEILERWEILDCGASRAFAVADHQLAHIYVREAADLAAVAALIRKQDGVERVYVGDERAAIGLDHPRSGEIIAIAARDRWFSYYFWEDDDRAPDYARTVDIHRKPGYDPVELFLDPKLPLVKARILGKLLQKKLGFRTLMKFIPLDPTLVKGSHGRAPDDDDEGPLVISSSKVGARDRLAATDFKGLVLETMFDR